MHTEHKTFDSRSFEDIASAVSARLEAGRELLHDAPPAACDGMNAILDDATAKLEHLQNLAMKFDWPNERPRGPESVSETPTFDADRYRRAVSSLRVLLASMDADDTGIQACDALENAITELQAAGGMEQ